MSEQKFNRRDAQAVLGLMENIQLQNLKAARELIALQYRFSEFVEESFALAAAFKEQKDAEPPETKEVAHPEPATEAPKE